MNPSQDDAKRPAGPEAESEETPSPAPLSLPPPADAPVAEIADAAGPRPALPAPEDAETAAFARSVEAAEAAPAAEASRSSTIEALEPAASPIEAKPVPPPPTSAETAAADSATDSSLKAMEGPVGRIAVGVAFGLLLLSVVLAWPVWLQQILLSGFIGGFTNTVAIHMLFTRVWYLPGSGVMLKRKDAIIRTLADTMQEHILNPSLIEERVRLLSKSVDPDRIVDGVNAIIGEIRGDAIAFLQAPEQRQMITEAVRKEGGFWGDMADAVGVVTYDKVADRVVGGLVKQLESFRVDRKMLDAATDYAGSIESFLLEPGNPLIRRHYGSERSVAQIVFEKLDARQLVIDKLSSYEAEQIRDIISENIKDHLAWLEVFGVILGMVISALILAVGTLLG